MSVAKKQTAIEKRAQNLEALKPFALVTLKQKLPLVFPRDLDLPPSPKPHYRSAYRYLGFDDLNEETIEVFSPFEIAVRLFDYSHLERLLAVQIYVASAKGQVPFQPVSMYLLSIYRRERNLSRHEVLRILRHPQDGLVLRCCTGFEEDFPSESGLRYFEGQLTPELQQEINALQLDLLYQAGLLPVKSDGEKKLSLSFDGMLHEARSHMRCSSVKASCYEPVPRPCFAQEKGKQGCDCRDENCEDICQQATPRDPEARLIVYSGNNKRATIHLSKPKSDALVAPGWSTATTATQVSFWSMRLRPTGYCLPLLDRPPAAIQPSFRAILPTSRRDFPGSRSEKFLPMQRLANRPAWMQSGTPEPYEWLISAPISRTLTRTPG
jgi:hypothetical protein